MPTCYIAMNGTNTATIWGKWVSNTTAATTINCAENTWPIWCTAASGSGATYSTSNYLFEENYTKETKEEKAARLQREEAARQLAQKRFEEQERARKEAEEKAKKLLETHLTEEQKEELRRNKAFHIVTAEGTRYRLDFRTHGNVKRLNKEGKAEVQYCAQPTGVPVGDAVLAQKLMLETDEKEFLRIANATRLTG